MADLSITPTPDRLYLDVPFSLAFNRKVKLIPHSQWNSDRRQWDLPNTPAALRAVRQIMRDVYGIDDQSDINLVDVIVTFNRAYDPERRLILFDHLVAAAYQFRQPVRLQDGAELIVGDLTTSGSVKYPRVHVHPGTKIKLTNVRADLVDNFDGRPFGHATVQVLNPAQTSADPDQPSTATRPFNLVTDPWIKAFDRRINHTVTVSLLTFFHDLPHYSRLAGETKAQDLAVMRFLLAILTTVYSRYDAHGRAYDWLELDDDHLVVDDRRQPMDDRWEADLLDTWHALSANGQFGAIVVDYLTTWQDRFNFGTNGHGFGQVSLDDYNAFVQANKRLTPDRIAKRTGSTPIKQLNRQVSESNNSPAVFSARQTEDAKNALTIPELIRWLLAYQSFAGITDKTKVLNPNDPKASGSPGWLYKLNPVFIEGDDLFTTLLANLVLLPHAGDVIQHPIWEFTTVRDYIDRTRQLDKIDNLAELYTNWSRLLYVQWDDATHPVVFSAVMPGLDTTDARLEPMTTWHTLKSGEHLPDRPKLDDLTTPLTHQLDHLLPIANQSDWLPGVVLWLKRLHTAHYLDHLFPTGDGLVTLANIGLISDGKPTSQMPAGDLDRSLTVPLAILCGNHDWPSHLTTVLEQTATLEKQVWRLVNRLNDLRHQPSGSSLMTDQLRALQMDRDQALANWLPTLLTGDWVAHEQAWTKQLRTLAHQARARLTKILIPADHLPVVTDDKMTNVDTALAQFDADVADHFGADQPVPVIPTAPERALTLFVDDILRNVYDQLGPNDPALVALSHDANLDDPALADLRELLVTRRAINHVTVDHLTPLDHQRLMLTLTWVLRLYARHQVGQADLVRTPGPTLIDRLKPLRYDPATRLPADRAMARMLTHPTVFGLHRQLTDLLHQLTRSTQPNRLDYGALAVDLYHCFGTPAERQAVLDRWSTAYFAYHANKNN